jgi:integrase
MATESKPRKHARGDGSTTQKTDGSWWAVVPLPADPTTGKRQRWWQRATPNTEKGAEQTRRRMLNEVASRPAPSTRYRLGDWLAAWVERRQGQLRPNTAKFEQQAIDRLAPLADIWLDALTPARIQAWVDAEALIYAPKTMQTRLAVLRAALTLAVDLELLPRNPAARVRTPRVPHTERPILTIDQSRALLALVDGTVYAPVFGVALTLGLRLGELLGLRWSDIDIDAGRLSVRRQSLRRPGHTDLDAPLKTPAARRTVPLPAPVVALLRRHRDRQRLALGRSQDLVCTSARGNPFHPSTVSQVWRRTYRAEVGAPEGMTFHDLRHSAASLLAAQGVPQPAVMAILGHTTPIMTAHYQHASEQSLDEAAAAIGRALDG